ncbi:MAG: DUF1501 domain-containing protein [Candidatus Promineifilaceae bacterium]
MKTDPHLLSRRQFLRQAACAGLGVTGMVNTMASLKLTAAALQTQSLSDYRAMVCIYLSGGNDSNNMLIPAGNAGSDPLRADYEAGRGAVSLAADTLHTLTIPASTGAFKKHHGGSIPPMGLHASMGEMAQMFNDGELAVVCNVGTMVYPFTNRADYRDEIVPSPPSLFSHSDQTLQWQTSLPDQPFQTGWGGRLADLLHTAYNSNGSNVSMSVSMDGINSWQRSSSPETALFSMGSSGIRPFSGYHKNGEALYYHGYEEGGSFRNPIYKNSRAGSRLQAFEQLIKLTSANLLEDAYAATVVSTREVEEVMASAEALANNNGIDYETIFTDATTSLGDQLKAVSRLISGRSALGNNRQVFFVNVGGYDTHQAILDSHADLMQELSRSLKAFRDALVASNDWDNVVAFTASDFSRTFTANGTDDDAGTDHAWGGHAVVMGGGVAGGDLYGHFPPLKLGDHAESFDAHTSRGRWIPTTSVDQYSAVMAKWMGADSSGMETIFPNLSRFDDPWTSSNANLNFLPESVNRRRLIVPGLR